MCAFMRSTLKSLAQLFQIPSESSGSCFHLFESRSSSKCLLSFIIYKRSLVITKAVMLFFESFRNGGKAKFSRRVVCKVISAGLYCACAPADMIPLTQRQNECACSSRVSSLTRQNGGIFKILIVCFPFAWISPNQNR